MEIDDALIRKVAKLARLELSEEDIQKFIPQFKEILEHFSRLREADISGVEPAFHPVNITARERRDEAKNGISQKEALSLSKHSQDGYFKGPRVMK